MNRMMKLFAAALVVPMAFTSCLKDEQVNKYDEIKPVVLIPNGNWPRSSSVAPIVYGEDVVTPQEIRVYVRYSYEGNAPADVPVTLRVDNAAIDAYNARFGTGYVAMSSNSYTLPSSGLTVTIPKGSREAYLSVMVDPLKIDKAKDNMLAFTIEDAPGQVVAENFKSYLLPVAVPNPFQGTYDAAGFFFHPTVPRDFHFDKHLSTINAARSEVDVLGDLGGWRFRFNVDGSNNVTGWGAEGSTFTEPQSAFMTLDNPGNISFVGTIQPGQGEWVHSTYNNTYDPDAQTFLLHYGYGGGATNQNGFTRQVYEKWVRK